MSVRKSLPALIAAAAVFAITFVFSASGLPARTLAAAGLPPATPTPLGGSSSPATQATPLPQYQAADQAIRAAFQKEVQQNNSLVPGLLVYEAYIDHIDFSQDGSTALVWMGLRDQQTGEVIASEPGLTIARKQKLAAPGDSSNWSFAFPGGAQSPADWQRQVAALPPELLTQDVQNRYLTQLPSETVASTKVFSGYKLPWTAGLAKRVTNSIGHYLSVDGGYASCPSTCQYAFDFADGTMFPMIAAKGGMVKSFKWTCPNGGTSCTNFLILEDQSTIPTSYQIYYHMAYDRIPARLRTVGAVVSQGEYIGDADDTGNSTGHHLHFHVYTTPTASDWSWGYSVDITFDDVPTNGGRPRTCSEARAYPSLGSDCLTNNLYTSGNTPAHPPSGSLDLPADKQMISSRTVRVQGSASDDIQVARIQVIANYDGNWTTLDDIPPNGNGPYGKDVDLCTANVPDGPFKLTVRIYDREGSLASGIPVRQMIKSYACGGVDPPAPPACIPAANQVALYADTDFRGACQKYDVSGSGYISSALSVVGDNNAESVQVGSSVRAVLFDRSSDATVATITGRVETLESNDSSLGDNRIGLNHISGLRVLPRTDNPYQPFIKPVGNRLTAGASPSSIDSLVLAWDGGVGAPLFDASLAGPGANWTKTNLPTNSISVGNLAAGNYTFTVWAKNSASTNNSVKTFIVTQASLPTATARTVPYTDTMESGAGNWVNSGLWRLGSIDAGGRGATNAWIFNDGTDYSDTTYRAGDLTSPPVAIPASGVYYLRFAYYMDTEDGNPYWDQRLVQVSADNGPFTDLVQLSDDKQPIGPAWNASGPLSLAKYAGKTIRVRFHFDTVNEDYNAGLGWLVDDVSINNTAPDSTCADNDNNTPDNAQSIAIGASVSAAICPERDIDYYKLSAKSGQPVVIDIDARSLNPASKLDSVVTLLDADKRSPIAENDDEKYGVLVDSLLSYVFQRDGTYTLKVKAWNSPGVGGKDYFYNMSIRTDIPVAPQDVQILIPTASNRVPVLPFTINVSATDYDGGQVAQVNFYWHGPNWSQDWVKIGVDNDGSDGWTSWVDPAQYGGVQGAALYVQALSRTGGVKGAVMWDLQPDWNTPQSKLDSLPNQINSSVFLLNWSANDYQNDIDHFDLQYRENTGSGSSAWKGWQDQYHIYPIPGNSRSAWFNGLPGASYTFRLRAVDRAGNTEAWLDQPEASTTIGATCTPDANEIPNQTQANAYLLTRSDFSPVLNFCKSSQPGMDDVDWFAVDGRAGEPLLVMILPGGGGSAFTANLYDGTGSRLATWNSPDYENSLSGKWTVPANGRYYLEVKPLHAGMAGSDMKYAVWAGPGSWFYLPVIGK